VIAGMKPTSTIVVGAGVVGTCAAYYLAKRGHQVTLIDREPVKSGASTGNAGIIALGHPPLPRPGLVWQTIKWMLNKGNPLYMPPRVDFGLFKWMWDFRKACTAEHFQHCMHILAEWGWATGRCWDQIVEHEQIDCEYRTTGWLDVFRTKEGMEHGLHEAELLRQYDFEVNVLTGDELRRLEPCFKPEIVGAAHYVDSRFVSPNKFITQLVERLPALGVEVITNAKVVRIKKKGDRFTGVQLADGRVLQADTAVLAAGVWTTELASTIGIRVPMQAGKGYHVNLTSPEPCPTISCVLNETFVAVNPMNGGLRLAGTVELSGINNHMIQRRVDMLSEGAKNYLYGIENTQITSSWCGLRPCTSDGLPIIGWAPGMPAGNDSGGVFIATGHAKYGLAYGPITGRVASECILDGKPSLDLSPMRVDRFDNRSARPVQVVPPASSSQSSVLASKSGRTIDPPTPVSSER
jgi:D-amino-acid dehydrogenase